MIKRIFSPLFFLLSFSTGFWYFNTIFTNNNTNAFTFSEYKKEAGKNNIDIVFFGSSHSYTSYNPKIIDKKTNLVSYNLGTPSLNIINTDIIIKESLKYNVPKLLVLDIFEGSLKELKTAKDKGYQLDALDRIPNTSPEKLEKIVKNYKKNEYVSVLFPLFRNHNLWNTRPYRTLQGNEPSGKEFYYYKGYKGYRRNLAQETALEYSKESNEIKELGSVFQISKKAKEHLISCFKIASYYEVEVLLIMSPELKNQNNTSGLDDALRNIALENNVNYIDLNNYFEEMELSTNDFMDAQHLNLQGGTKVSQFLGAYINNEFDLDTK